MDCHQTRRLIEKIFIQQSSDRLPEVHRHLSSCGRCRDLYNRIFAADSALSRTEEISDRVLSVTEKSLLRSVVFGEAKDKRVQPRRWPYLSAAVAACGAAALVFLLLGKWSSPKEEFTARGTGPTATVAAPLGLRALCLARSPRGIDVRSLGVKPLTGEKPSCTIRDRLGLAIRNETDRSWHLQGVVIRSGGKPLLGFPDSVVAPGRAEEALTTTLPTSNVGAGKIQIYGIFSSEQLAPQTLLGASVASGPLQALRNAGAGYVVHLAFEIGE